MRHGRRRRRGQGRRDRRGRGWRATTFLMSTGSARPLEDAYRVSQHDLVGWAAELTGLDTLDAYQLVSQAGLAPAGNVVDTNYTMVAKLAKSAPGAAEAFDGVHARLRDVAAGYLRTRLVPHPDAGRTTSSAQPQDSVTPAPPWP